MNPEAQILDLVNLIDYNLWLRCLTSSEVVVCGIHLANAHLALTPCKASSRLWGVGEKEGQTSLAV